MREPDGYHSWGGTENNLNLDYVKKKAREGCTLCKKFLSSEENGRQYGQQRCVARSSRVLPRYIVHYTRK